MPRSWTVMPLLAIAIALPGCGGGGGSDKKADTAGARTSTSDVPGKLPPPKERKAARQEAADQKEQARELKNMNKEDRDFDRAFKQDAFERLVNKLPIRKSPLYVAQYITGDGHKLYTAVERKRFCKLSAGDRQKAVASFFESADRSFRRAHVEDFEQVVTPLSDSIDKLPALATARRGAVSLTSLGRRC